jgi:hypothetical protein
MNERRMSQGKPIATGVRITVHDDDATLTVDLNRDGLETLFDVLHECFVGHAPRKRYAVGPYPQWLAVEDLVDGIVGEVR